MTSDTAGLHPGVVKTAKQQEAARRLRKICGGDAGEEAVIIDSVDPHPYMMNRGDKRGAKTGNESQIDRMKLMVSTNCMEAEKRDRDEDGGAPLLFRIASLQWKSVSTAKMSAKEY